MFQSGARRLPGPRYRGRRAEHDVALTDKERNDGSGYRHSDTDRPIASRPDSLQQDRERNGSARGAIARGGGVGATGTPLSRQPQVVGAADGATAGGEHGIAQEGVGSARLLVSDVGTALLLLDEARYRVVKRLFGVSRDRSWAVTLIALAVLAQAAHDKSDQMLKGPGGPTRADVVLGAAALRELLAGIPGPSSRDTPLVATLVMIAVAGALVRPALSRTAHGIRTSSHRARLSFRHRYGHLLPASAR